MINRIQRNRISIKSPRRKLEETQCTTSQNQGVRTIVNIATSLQVHRVYCPAWYERVFLVPEMGILARNRIVATTMRMSNIDTDRFPRRSAHRSSSSVIFVFPSLNCDTTQLLIDAPEITETMSWFCLKSIGCLLITFGCSYFFQAAIWTFETTPYVI